MHWKSENTIYLYGINVSLRMEDTKSECIPGNLSKMVTVLGSHHSKTASFV